MTKRACYPLIPTLILGLFGTAVQASGYIPLPERHETLPSFKACVARLESAYTEDSKLVLPRTVLADGTIRQVGLETQTKGIERLGRKKARYHGRIWYANGRTAAHDPMQREFSHSWNERELLCEGSKLTINGAQGYTLSTFEPIRDAEQGDNAGNLVGK